VHQFGHVVGVYDRYHSLDSKSAMADGIELSALGELTLTPTDLERARNYRLDGYTGRKHPAALVTTTGRCLEVGSDGSISAKACHAPSPDPPPAQDFTFSPNGIMSFASDPARCLRVSGTEALVADCASFDPNAQFALRRAQWSSYGRCVAPLSYPADAGTPVVIEACEPVGTPSQAWTFDITGATEGALLARIRFDDDLCVTVPGGVIQGVVTLELDDCEPGSDSEQIFDLRSDFGIASPTFGGTIGFGVSSCLGWPMTDGSVWVTVDCPAGQRWVLTGPLETSSGWALTLPPGAARATASPLTGLPGPNQIFDFYF
jgi:hypothetical protein